ncbi:rhomboid family intramembrane serine protease GlpG [Biostraticola tofi]|uniref:Rhomboid protease GlpG n=1 Tax=Biostraticola tofi TaxID=466109 RepID=A0A4R3YRN1_9GAMM|nr:rhomboid family intramembrane serine protease GlpG [Biostraticola tofi]TCV93683.1 GlpG protein [Biostraticola tofi]
MIRVTALSNPRLAQAFIDYMKTQGVTLELVQQGQAAELWLKDEDQLAQTEQALEIFLLDPMHPRYLAASWRTGSTANHEFRYATGGGFSGLRAKAGPLTLVLTAACVLVFILMALLGDDQVMYWLAYPAGPEQYVQVWRWFSHVLLHFSLLHILFNLMWWWYLGGAMEKFRGTGRLLLLTVLSAVLSGVVQYHFSGVFFGGLSGVVYALMGYVWWYGEQHPDSPLNLPRGLIIFALLWLIAGYFDIFGIAIANAAHVAGLVVGLLMAFWDSRHRVGR